MIFLPVEVSSSNCAYVYDKDTIRVYEEVPTVNATVSYTDYFVNSHYLSRTGSTTFGQWNNSIPSCLSASSFSTNAIYRNDFPFILIMAFIYIFVCWFLISKLYRRLCYGRKIF